MEAFFGLLKSERPYLQAFESIEPSSGSLRNLLIPAAADVSRQSERACRPLFTGSKPFRLLGQFYFNAY